MIRIVTLTAFLISFYFFIPFIKHEDNTISCNADLSYHWKKNRLDLLINQHLDNGKGFLSITGIAYDDNKVSAYLAKTISFSYQHNRSYYSFNSQLIINSPQMTMSSSEQNKWLPEFFTEPNKPLLLKVRPYGKDTWIFYSENTPLLICERSH